MGMNQQGPLLALEESVRHRDALGRIIEEAAHTLGRDHKAIAALYAAGDAICAATQLDPSHGYCEYKAAG